jgi:hypothetical protein
MNYFDLYSSYPDQTITAAWYSQVAQAEQTPGLKEVLLRGGSELFPHFAVCYAELRALSRGARRGLQRRIARSSELAANFPECLQTAGRRALQHQLARSLAGAALLLALGQGIAEAATITVTTNNPRIKSDGRCSLIEAIVNANNDAATHADCVSGSGADTIVLPAKARMALSNVKNSKYGPTGLPLITSPITIEGNNAKIIRSAVASPFRLVAVSSSGDLTLQDVTLRGGSSVYGGAVVNNGTLTIQRSTISGNVVSHRGGGVYNSGTLVIENSTISGNTSHNRGGGVDNGSSYYGYNSVTIINSTISGNRADNRGGGIYNVCFFCVGVGSTVTITNSTISRNTAETGGGIFNHINQDITLNRSLISGNTATVGREITDFYGSVTADNFNLFGANGKAGVKGFTPGLTDIVPGRRIGAVKILGILKNNGGSTKTHALKPGSPALDVIPFTDPDCTGPDQRGMTRPQGLGCDIGAFERDGP